MVVCFRYDNISRREPEGRVARKGNGTSKDKINRESKSKNARRALSQSIGAASRMIEIVSGPRKGDSCRNVRPGVLPRPIHDCLSQTTNCIPQFPYLWTCGRGPFLLLFFGLHSRCKRALRGKKRSLFVGSLRGGSQLFGESNV